jgi:acyl-[acyl-carrier-protein] desaturase
MPVGDIDATVYHELEKVVGAGLERHLAAAQEWFPHEYVPWDEAADFDRVPWQHSQSRLPKVAQTSLVLNLLTEDNLPSYHFEIGVTLGREDAWAAWLHRWTAEEDRHSIAIRDYLLVTRSVDPVALERARMQHMSHGYRSPYRGNVLHLMAYLLFQELATRVSHRNTGTASGDPVCQKLLTRISLDENLHMLFYRDLLAAALELVPDAAMSAIAHVISTFQMPGAELPDFGRRSLEIANAGIYDPQIHHDHVVSPTLRKLGVFDLSGLSAPGEQAREQLASTLTRMERTARRFVDRRDARRAAGSA